MAGKKVKNEVEGIRAELQHLSEAVWALREHITIQSAAASAMPGRDRPESAPARDGKSAPGLAPDARGAVVTSGMARTGAGGGEYRWEIEAAVDDLLAADDDQAARVLAAIGHRQRLAILKTLLARPVTAAELVKTLDLGTTGAAYHHLNVLQAAGVVTQEGRGAFAVHPDRVAMLLAVLAGVEATASVVLPEPPESAPAEASVDGTKRKSRKSG